jgi:hypothetical protein
MVMALKMVNSKLTGMYQGKVTLEGDTIEELMSTKAREEAIVQGRRALGMFRVGISGSSGPWPVDQDGEECIENVQPGMKYRNEFDLNAGLGG